jgi:hypothetical protein
MPDISFTYGNSALAAPVVPATTYYLSLHSADPGISGANELTDPDYSRQSITFGDPFGNTQTSTNGQSFSLSLAIAGNLWFGVWTAVSSGSYLIGDPNAAVTGPIPTTATVTFNTSAVSIAAS